MESALEGTEVSKIMIATDYGSWFWFLFITVILYVLWSGIQSFIEGLEIKKHWEKYRCSPFVMPFANLYGFDAKENFNYCIGGIFKNLLPEVTNPFATILQLVISNIQLFLKNMMSMRTMFASMIGGLRNMFMDFKQRVKLITGQIQVAGLRLQMLLQRTFATFYAVIYMGLSGITAGQNFGDTIIFKFMDTFCFDPDTPIAIRGKGTIPISTVQLGDICDRNGAKVTSTYRFFADSQPMVYLPNLDGTKILVSTNHYVKHNGAWIRSDEHPNAEVTTAWAGGKERPLICLDTETHQIPLGDYIFSDYDETEESDAETMEWVEQRLNAQQLPPRTYAWPYQPVWDPEVKIQLADGTYKSLREIGLQEELSTGYVAGIVRRHIYQTAKTPKGTTVSPSSLYWQMSPCWWLRAGNETEVTVSTTPIEMIGLVVVGQTAVETEQGERLRDFAEIHSPDLESFTTKALQKTTM